MVTPLVLATLNARYAHSAFGLRYLLANLGALRERAVLLEGTLEERPVDFVEKILHHAPVIVGLSVYIWNASATLEVVRILKKVAPQVRVVLGGPEVSYELESQEIVALADHVVIQEGERVFRELCERTLAGDPPADKVIRGGQPPLEELALPYSLYSDDDVRHRVLYVEASRGCPFRCEFCLSSLDERVRYWPLPQLLAAFEDLLARGATQLKFIDRTFNLRIDVSRAILEFFLERYRAGLFLHFEMVPDRFPGELRELIARFPPGAIQFEVGIQSFDEEVQKRISRRQNNSQLGENLRYLRHETGVHVHADLIIGLPGETLEGFGQGFDRLVALGPQEIQVGILKRLRGTPIVRHDGPYSMVYSDVPPYEILSTGAIPFAQMMRAKRFARYWDLFSNRGNFRTTLPLLLGEAPFQRFAAFSDWLFARGGQTHKIALVRQAELLFEYLKRELDLETVARALAQDYGRVAFRSALPFLVECEALPSELRQPPRQKGINSRASLPTRQTRHLALDAAENSAAPIPEPHRACLSDPDRVLSPSL